MKSMKRPFFSWMLIVSTASCILSQTSKVLAEKIAEINAIAQKITVRVDSKFSGSGSGVLIKKQLNRYTILTAAHVVAPEDNYRIETPDHRIYPIDSHNIYRLAGVDLAILQFQSNESYSVAHIGNSTSTLMGTDSYVAGFPVKTLAITAPIYQFTIGKITANANQPLADGYALVYSNNTLPGMSGGPVLNAKGDLIGIHGRADTTDQSQKPTDNPAIFIKTGFNLGIPINTFLSLVSQMKPDLKFHQPAQPQLIRTFIEQDAFLEGVDKVRRKDYVGAIAKFSETLQLKTDFPDAYFNRGVARSQIGDITGALQDYTQAIQLNPDLANAYFNRAVIHEHMGNRQRANLDYETAIRLQPNFPEAHYNLGIAQWESGALAAALLSFDQAIRFKPRFAAAYYNQGVVRYQMKDLPGAIAAFSEALLYKPDDADTYYNRGAVRAESRDFAGAISDLQTASALYQQNKQSERAKAALDLANRLRNRWQQ